jgi:hypothetical protein
MRCMFCDLDERRVEDGDHVGRCFEHRTFMLVETTDHRARRDARMPQVVAEKPMRLFTSPGCLFLEG